MQNLKQSLLLLGALGLSACGMLTPKPASNTPTQPPVTGEVTPDITPLGTAPICSGSGGHYPYSSSGPLWRQWVYLNDNGLPLNYSTFTTDLRPSSYYKLTEYPINATGSKAYPAPLSYQYLYSPTFSIPGTLVGADNSQNVALQHVYLSGSVSYGLVYQAPGKDYALPVISSANNYKLVNSDGTVQSTVNSASQTMYPRINGNIVRIPGGQAAKLEFYLDPTPKLREEVIQANYLDPVSKTQKNDWVKVNMPYQEGYLKVTTGTYFVYEPTGVKTYTTSTTPLPKFKFMLRGYNNISTTDRRFLTHQGIYYARPYGIGSDQASLNTWLDGRNDLMMRWNHFDRKVARVTLDASQNPVIVAGTSSTPANWNLGIPGFANDRNCISKTVKVEPGDASLFSVVQPAGHVLLDSSDSRIARLDIVPKNLMVPLNTPVTLKVKAFDASGAELGLVNPREITLSAVGTTALPSADTTDGFILTGLATVKSYHLKFTAKDQPSKVAYSYLSVGKTAPDVKVLSADQLVFPRADIKEASLTLDSLAQQLKPFTTTQYGAALSAANAATEVPMVVYAPDLKVGDHVLFAGEAISGVVARIEASTAGYALAVLTADALPQQVFSEYQNLTVDKLPADDPDRIVFGGELKQTSLPPMGEQTIAPQSTASPGISKQGFQFKDCNGTNAAMFDLIVDGDIDFSQVMSLFAGNPNPKITARLKLGAQSMPNKGITVTCSITLLPKMAFALPGTVGAFLSGSVEVKMGVAVDLSAAAYSVGGVNITTLEVGLLTEAPYIQQPRVTNDWNWLISGASGDLYSVNGLYMRANAKIEGSLDSTIDITALNAFVQRQLNAVRKLLGLTSIDDRNLRLASFRIGPSAAVAGQFLSMNAVATTTDSSQVNLTGNLKASFGKDIEWVKLMNTYGIKFPMEFTAKLFEVKTINPKLTEAMVTPVVASSGNVNVALQWEPVPDTTLQVDHVQLGANPENSLNGKGLGTTGGNVSFNYEECRQQGIMKANVYASSPMYFVTPFGTATINPSMPFNPKKDISVDCRYIAKLSGPNPESISTTLPALNYRDFTITFGNVGIRPMTYSFGNNYPPRWMTHPYENGTNLGGLIEPNKTVSYVVRLRCPWTTMLETSQLIVKDWTDMNNIVLKTIPVQLACTKAIPDEKIVPTVFPAVGQKVQWIANPIYWHYQPATYKGGVEVSGKTVGEDYFEVVNFGGSYGANYRFCGQVNSYYSFMTQAQLLTMVDDFNASYAERAQRCGYIPRGYSPLPPGFTLSNETVP